MLKNDNIPLTPYIQSAEYPTNLLNSIAVLNKNDPSYKWEYKLPEDIDNALSYVISTLTKTEQRILLSAYRDGKNCTQIAKNEKLTQRVIKTNIVTILNKISCPPYINYLRWGMKKGHIMEITLNKKNKINDTYTKIEKFNTVTKQLDYPLNMLTAVAITKTGDKNSTWECDIPKDFDNALNTVCHDFNNVEKDVLFAFFKNKKSLPDIATERNMPKAHIDNVIDECLKILAQDNNYTLLQLGKKSANTDPTKKLSANVLKSLSVKQCRSKSPLQIYDKNNPITCISCINVFLNANLDFNKDNDDSLDALGFSTKTCNVLRKNGINTVGELKTLTVRDIVNMYSFGDVCFDEILEKSSGYVYLDNPTLNSATCNAEVFINAINKQISRYPRIKYEEVTCPNCKGYINEKYVAYCKFCGQKLEWNFKETKTFPQNLLDRIATVINDYQTAKWTYPLPDDFDAALDHVLDTLSEREKQFILKHYKNQMSFRQIAAEEQITAARVSQITAKAVHKMTHESPKRYLILGLAGTEEYNTNQALIEERQQEAERMFHAHDPNWELKQQHIQTLGLSVRSFNALIRAGYNTIGDVIAHTIPEIHILTNIGEKSANEIVEKIHNLHLKFMGEHRN